MSDLIEEENNENNVVPFNKFSEVLNEFLQENRNVENLVIDVKNEFIAFTVPRKNSSK
jgi:hypothetical protein